MGSNPISQLIAISIISININVYTDTHPCAFGRDETYEERIAWLAMMRIANAGTGTQEILAQREQRDGQKPI